MAPSRIAVLASHPIQYQAELFRRLAAHPRVDVTVFFCWNFGIDRPGFDEGFGQAVQWDIPLLNGYKHKVLTNLSVRPSSRFFGQINPTVFREFRRSRFDAVLVHGYQSLSAWLGVAAATAAGLPVLFRGETDLGIKRALWKRAMKRVILWPLFKSVDAALYSCGANRRYFEHYGVRSDRLFFLPCAVDNDFWRAQADEWTPKRSDIRAELGISDDRPMLLVAGKLIPWKRPQDALDALTRLSEALRPWLVFVGDGPLRAQLEEEVRARSLGTVRFAGFKNQSEIGRYYAAADMLLITSQHEKSSKVMNEAMNFGLPVIATDQVSTAPDLIVEGRNGAVFKMGDLDELVATLRRLLTGDAWKSLSGPSRTIVSSWTFDADVTGVVAALDACCRQTEKVSA